MKNNRAPLLNNIKLYASFYHHMWIQTVIMVRKQLNGVMTSGTLTFDIWPWPFAWTSLLSLVITPGNFLMIRWEEHCQKGVTDRRTDRQTEIAVLRAAWSQLKMEAENWNDIIYTYIYIYTGDGDYYAKFITVVLCIYQQPFPIVRVLRKHWQDQPWMTKALKQV